MAAAEVAEQKKEQLPLNFGKRLAHTDKVVRDKGFRILKTWLAKNPALERLDYLKLWKGLYFGMWMADKRPVQQELAVNVAMLINEIPAEKRIVWMDAFWETLEGAWEKLDTHRMNKYMLFARIAVAEYFKVLREAGWKLEEVQAAAKSFTRSTAACGITGPNVHSLGLTLHFCKLFWEELRPQLEEKPKASQEVLLALLEPFCSLAERSYSDALVKQINEHMLRCPPEDLKAALLNRVTEAAGKDGVPKKNRQALRETAKRLGAEAGEEDEEDDAERPARKRKAFGTFQPKDKKDKKKKKAKKPEEAAAGGGGSNDSAHTMSPLLLPPALDGEAGGERKASGKKKKVGKRAAGAGAMSPLSLPAAEGDAPGRSSRALKRAGRREAKVKNATQAAAARSKRPTKKRKAAAAGANGEAKPRPTKKRKKAKAATS